MFFVGKCLPVSGDLSSGANIVHLSPTDRPTTRQLNCKTKYIFYYRFVVCSVRLHFLAELGAQQIFSVASTTTCSASGTLNKTKNVN